MEVVNLLDLSERAEQRGLMTQAGCDALQAI